jgi:hypothetical protein
LQPGLAGDPDIFVTKLNAAGSALVYSTYLGGTGGEGGSGIAVDAAGNAYVTGGTDSPDFPTQNPLQPGFGGGDCGVFPCADAFIAKLNAAGSALVYSTYLGGSGGDGGGGIAVDAAGNAYVTGGTGSTDFPTKNPLQPALNGINNAFVTKLNAAGSALVYSTYLGGSGGDGGLDIAVDSAGNAYVIGGTGSTDFPTADALQPALGGSGDAFIAMLNAAGSALVYSTYLGGSIESNLFNEYGLGIAVDSAGNAYVMGVTDSTDFPTVNPIQPAFGGGGIFFNDAFVAKIATGLVTVHIAIDIKPGSSVNNINPRSNGSIPVVILTTDSFDATSADPSTVRFGRTGEEAAPLHHSLEDVDGDGDLDLALHFATQQTGILCGDSSARLTGKTFDGQQLEGSDSVRTVGCQ